LVAALFIQFLPTKERGLSMRRPFSLILVGVCLVCLWLSVLACSPKVVVQPTSYPMSFYGRSMEPAVHTQMGLVQAYGVDEAPKRGDIICFHAPPEPTKNYDKRVIGIPGDVIVISGSTVILNGITLTEPYVAPGNQGNPSPYQHLFVIVPTDEFFVLGDNRAVSFDSRFWRFVPRSNVFAHLLSLYTSSGYAQPVPDYSYVYAQAAKRHVTGTFLSSDSGYSGWYYWYSVTGNAALFLFLPLSFPVCSATRSRKKTLKREDRGLL
jgi:signal peptidase I